MGTFELINAAVSLLGGAVLTIWSNSQKDRHEEHLRSMERQNAREESTRAAREVVAPWKGYYWIRGAIAITVAAYFFIIPAVVVLFMDGVQVVIGYYDTAYGFWPWSSPQESVTWVKTGAADAARVLVYDPVKNNVLISVIGMYFGNQFARRG
jgi:hypothetical protein